MSAVSLYANTINHLLKRSQIYELTVSVTCPKLTQLMSIKLPVWMSRVSESLTDSRGDFVFEDYQGRENL